MLRVLLLCLLIWSLLFSSAVAQFQAQAGWGLPRQIASSSVTQGVVLDAAGQRVIVADQQGLVEHAFDGAAQTVLLEQSGVRGLVGAGSGQSLALVWYSRSLSDNNAVWAWYRGQTKKLMETQNSSIAITLLNGVPVIAYAAAEGEQTTVYLERWGTPRVAVYRTRLNVGALSLGVAPSGQIGVLFAEGYRNAQDEKYDAIWLTGRLEQGSAFKRQRLGAAVFAGREQRYAVAVRGDQLLPVWWFESDDDQRRAALTKRHNPRLAVWDGAKPLEFAAAGNVIGQSGDLLYYSLESDLWALELGTLKTARQLIAPRGIITGATASTGATRFAAWQNLQSDGFASQVWLSDSKQPYQPNLIDRLSVSMGWNPWYAGQSALAQIVLSALIAAGTVMLTAPVIWLISTFTKQRINLWVSAAIGAGFVIVSRVVSGTVSAPNWSLEALLTPPWWTAVLGVLFGMGVVWLLRKRISATDLAPTIVDLGPFEQEQVGQSVQLGGAVFVGHCRDHVGVTGRGFQTADDRVETAVSEYRRQADGSVVCLEQGDQRFAIGLGSGTYREAR